MPSQCSSDKTSIGSGARSEHEVSYGMAGKLSLLSAISTDNISLNTNISHSVGEINARKMGILTRWEY